MNLKKMIGVVIALVITLVLFPVINAQTENYNTVSKQENLVAVEDDATPEVITLEETPTAINIIKVDGVTLTVTTDYTLTGATLTILTLKSATGEAIIINYDYEYETTGGLDAVMTMFGTLVLVGLVGYFSKQMFFSKK